MEQECIPVAYVGRIPVLPVSWEGGVWSSVLGEGKAVGGVPTPHLVTHPHPLVTPPVTNTPLVIPLLVTLPWAHTPGQTHPLATPHPCEQTDACENTTIPALLRNAVGKNT